MADSPARGFTGFAPVDTVRLGAEFSRPAPPPYEGPSTDTQMVGLLKSLVTSVELLRMEVANQPAPQVTVGGSEVDLSPVAEALARIPRPAPVDHDRLAEAISRFMPDNSALLDGLKEHTKKLSSSWRSAALTAGGGSLNDGYDGTGIVAPAGGSGMRGWLSGIYSKLSGTLTTAVATSAAGIQAQVTGYGKLRTSPEPTSVFYDPFDSAIDTVTKWQTPAQVSGATLVQGAGGVTLTSGTTAGAYANLQSRPTFVGTVPGFAEVGYAISFLASPPANIHRFWGVGTIPGTPTAAAPLTDAVGWEVGVDQKLRAVVYNAGVRTVIADLTALMPTDGLYHRYSLVMRTDRTFWYIDSQDKPLATSNFQFPNVQRLPLLLQAVVAAGASSTSSVACTGVGVGDSSRSGQYLMDGTNPHLKAAVSAAGALSVSLPAPVGTPKYYSGVSGTVTPLNGERLLAVTCHATTAGTVTVFGGSSIPVPANAQFFDSLQDTDGQWLGDGVKTLQFTGTDSYYVRVK